MMWLFVVAIIMPMTMATNLTDVKWAHAVNSLADLEKALASNVNAIEADVLMGYHKGAVEASSTAAEIPEVDALKKSKNNKIPIMSHAEEESDLTLDLFLAMVKKYNAEHANTTKAQKLDFKSKDALKEATKMLKKDWNETYSKNTWINADFLKGPGGKDVEITQEDFFKAAMKLENATLSLGWTTGGNLTGKAYEQKHIDEMIKAVNSSQISKDYPITFAIRANLAVNSEDLIKTLIDGVSKNHYTTITVWSSVGDEVKAEDLSKFIKNIGIEKVYIDLPKELHQQVNVSGASSLVQFGIVNMIALAFAFFFRNALH